MNLAYAISYRRVNHSINHFLEIRNKKHVRLVYMNTNLILPVYIKLHQPNRKAVLAAQKRIQSYIDKFDLNDNVTLKQVIDMENNAYKMVYEIRVPVHNTIKETNIGLFLDVIFSKQFHDQYPSYTEPITD